MLRFINVGYWTVVQANRVIAIANPDSAPIKRMIDAAREGGNLLDATFGRRSRSMILMDNGTIILSAVSSETLTARLEGREA